MKNVLAISAAALITLTGAASAATSAYEAQVQKFAPEADLSGLTGGEVAHLVSIINDDSDDSFVQTQAQVRGALKSFN